MVILEIVKIQANSYIDSGKLTLLRFVSISWPSFFGYHGNTEVGYLLLFFLCESLKAVYFFF